MKPEPVAASNYQGRTRQQVRQIFLIQLAVACLVSGIACAWGWVAAYSAALGGLIHLIPNSYFAWRVFAKDAPQNARQALGELYSGEIWKMAIAAVCFAAVFILVHPLSPFSLFFAFIVLSVTQVLLHSRLNNRFLKL